MTKKECPYCFGKGVTPVTKVTCDVCDGTGEVPDPTSGPKWAYCYLYKQGMSGIYHRCNDQMLPACGARVDTTALEHSDGRDIAGYDPCKRCFR